MAVVNLLPSGLEVENPRLQTTEQLPWVTDASFQLDYLDLRDDRILVFTDLAAEFVADLLHAGAGRGAG